MAVRTDVAAKPKGRAQAELLARVEAAGGRARVADLVRDRPSLRGAVDRLAELGALRIETERDARSPAGLPAVEAVAVEPTADQLAGAACRS